MSPAQTTLYWKRWSQVCRVNGWVWRKGQLDPEAVGPQFSEHHAAVWKAAEARALQEHRAVTADDLRHGCHIYATKRDLSMKDMPNSAFSRLLCLWGDGKNKCGLLIEADCIESRMHWEDPTLNAAEGTKAALKKFPEATVRHVAEDKFGSRMFEWLEPDQQRELLMTLKGWARKREKAVEPDPENQPF